MSWLAGAGNMRLWGHIALALLLAVAAGAGARAADEKQPPPKTLQELDRKLADTFAKLKIPGASIAIIENNQVVMTKGYGVSDVAARKAVTPDTVFRAGSISKNMVGIAVMMLVEEGKLDLNAKLADLAPEIKFTNPWEATDPVRLAHLMEHTTGFDDIRFSQYLLDGKNMPLAKAIELYGPYVSRWKPGTYVAYSNAPPVIAGYIVEKYSGQSWADFTRTRIFEPLGMTSAHWDRAPAIEANLSKSYRSNGISEEPYVDIPGKPAGSLNVTPTDLAKFALMMIGRGTVNGVTLLKPESVDRIETPKTSLAVRQGLTLGYGLGNYALAREKSVFHGHDGGIDGFAATYAYEAAHGAGYVAMINQANGEALQAMEVITGYLERDWPKPEVARVEQPPEALAKLAGFYQQAAPRVQMLAPLELLFDWMNIKVEHNKMTIDDVERIPVGPMIFQRADRSAPSAVFVNGPAGAQMLTGTGARRQVPQVELLAKAAFGLAYGAALATSAFFFFIWVIGWLTGRLSKRGGVLVRALPALAIFSVPLFGIMIAMALADESWAALTVLGTPSLTAQTIYALSLSIPLLGVLSLATSLAARFETPFFVRALAFVNGALALSVAVYLWHYGWIGLKTWI
jgi:CubicO group peptidase (beta-lactamase class C family)